MKKYYQAVLFVTAIVSLVSLLFYRHEYNKLRYVLEVFNYFGKACPPVPKLSCPKRFNLDLNEPSSTWQRLDDDLYVYSSYVIDNRKIESISYGKLNYPNLDCIIFFNNLLTPILGTFSFTKIGNTSDIPGKTAYRGYILACEYTENMIPVGVSYQQKYQKLYYNPNSSIFPVKVQDRVLAYNGSALCVAPPINVPMSHMEMMSFLNFHELIGMSNFLVYDYGIPDVFHRAIRDLVQDSSPNWNFTYQVIPWNFPIREIHPNIIRNIITTDCLYRTYNKVLYAAVLSWEEYIVLKIHKLVPDLFADYEKKKIFGNRYVIQTQTFCTQQKDNKTSASPMPFILRKLHTSPNALNANMFYIHKPHETVNAKSVETLIAATKVIAVNRYVLCNDYNANNVESNKYEPSILKFDKDITNSTIYLRYASGNMFH